jgi:hypothetical protein
MVMTQTDCAQCGKIKKNGIGLYEPKPLENSKVCLECLYDETPKKQYDHNVEWTHDGDGNAQATLTCDAPKGSSCRLSAEGEYEYATCQIIETILSCAAASEACIESEGTPIRSGPIKFEYDPGDEWWQWKYAV